MQDERSPLHAASEGAARRAVKGKLRVLIADDDRDMVATLAAILNDEGHTVREVYRGTEVLRLIEQFDPDVALVDIGMPGMSGYDVAREVRETHDKRPMLIAITGWKKPSDRILARLVGFDHHLPKPFEARDLLNLLDPVAASGASSGTR
ncbi:MAG: response regulator [Betaproteobacteria bacterium]|nr:MAG: response regulator [Betaproteobacteria bacterium]